MSAQSNLTMLVWKILNLELEIAEDRIRSSGPACLNGLKKITIVVIQFNESVFVVIL